MLPGTTGFPRPLAAFTTPPLFIEGEPAGVRRRMRLLPRPRCRDCRRSPRQRLAGPLNWALVAGPLSPLKPAVPFPATVVITPFETLRTRLLLESAIYRLPAESTATPRGRYNWALVAGPLSPLKPPSPFPATVVITPFETLRMRLLPSVGDVQVAGGVHGDACRVVQLGAGGRAVVAAEASASRFPPRW